MGHIYIQKKITFICYEKYLCYKNQEIIINKKKKKNKNQVKLVTPFLEENKRKEELVLTEKARRTQPYAVYNASSLIYQHLRVK